MHFLLLHSGFHSITLITNKSSNQLKLIEMKKQHLTLLIMGMLIIFTANGFSQTISFTYDDTGNRLTRALTIQKINNNDSYDADDDQKSTNELIETITIDDVKVTISPNPNGGKFDVAISNPGDQPKVEIYLHSITGTQIFSSAQVQPITTVNITNRENGAYILTVIVNGTKEAWKVIKQ